VTRNCKLFVNACKSSLLVLLAVGTQVACASEWQYQDVERVIAVSDIHGEYDGMVRTFSNAGVIDDELAWAAGDAHLVITGDLLDRGPDSRKVMDLIMRLEGEAAVAGGEVHQLVGNHEVMNLAGDLRYVSVREYAAFSEDEDEEDRERWFQHFRSSQLSEADEATLREAFNQKAPPGFFGHRRAFRADGYYGKWLLDKPLMIVINGTAFVHGGVSPYVAEHGLEGVNGTLGAELRRYVMATNALEDAGVLNPIESLYDHAGILKALMQVAPLAESDQANAETVIALNRSEIHGPNSPLWYRGTVGCNELSESDSLEAAFDRIGADRVVIGHTPTVTRQVLQRMSGRVIEIDTGMLSASYKGSGNALIIEGDTLTVVNESGRTTSPPMQHPRRVGRRPDSLSLDRLTEILQTGAISAASEDNYGRTLVQVTAGEDTVHAFFDQNPRKKGFVPEMAAYKLDRLIGLDMVPATVQRDFDGKKGTLQFYPATQKSETERASSGRSGSGWCPLKQQWNTMYIFDVLIHNPGRDQSFMLYDTSNWSLFLVEHDKSFGTQKGRPAYLQNVPLDIGEQWQETLTGLSDDVLKAELGDVLDKRRISALAKRRDGLLESAGASQ
jgi:hypothetical protein